MEKRTKEKGITLIALVVTIIILIILAGVSINLVLGDHGIVTNAKRGKVTYSEEQAREKLELILAELQTEKITNDELEEYDHKINKRIQESGMEINDNIVTVDGWKFQIDRSVPKIGARIGDGKAIAIDTPYIGTTSFTTKLSYLYQQEQIESYTYIIDGVEITKQELEYTKEELEAESIHTVKVIANYKDGETIESNEITLKTEPRTYLYNNRRWMYSSNRRMESRSKARRYK